MRKILATALLLTLMAGGVHAFESGEPQAAPDQVGFERSEKEAFAVAFVDVNEIRNRYAASLEGTQSQEQAMDIQQEANMAMLRAIEERGLGVDTYNAIATAAGRDEELANELQGLIDAVQSE